MHEIIKLLSTSFGFSGKTSLPLCYSDWYWEQTIVAEARQTPKNQIEEPCREQDGQFQTNKIFLIISHTYKRSTLKAIHLRITS